MPNITNADWGPSQLLIVPDQTLSQEQVSRGFGLDKIALEGFSPTREQKTVTSFMSKLLELLGQQPALKNVTLTQDYPQSIEQSPRVVWSLEGRESGIEGKNRKTPFLAETWPTDDGRILEKWMHPQSFQVSFECFGSNPDEAETIKEAIEFYLVRNPYAIYTCGGRQFFFNSEGSHGKFVAGGAAEPLDKRTLHYWGAMDVVYINEVDRINTIEVRRVTDNTQVLTIPIVRASDGSMADIFPIPGPVVLLMLHDVDDRLSVDYFPNTDYTFVIDREKYGSRFFLNWITQGRTPLPGTTYYATYVLSVGGEITARDEYAASSDPALNDLPATKIKRRGLIQGRAAITPRILGQAVDLTDNERSIPINITGDDTYLETPSLSTNIIDALCKAQIQVAAVLDPSRIPGLAPGSAFSPPGTT